MKNKKFFKAKIIFLKVKGKATVSTLHKTKLSGQRS